jgi:hypothetical protein
MSLKNENHRFGLLLEPEEAMALYKNLVKYLDERGLMETLPKAEEPEPKPESNGFGSKRYDCDKRGFPALCSRFRKYLKEAAPNTGGGINDGEFVLSRKKASVEFCKAENLDVATHDNLICHVPIYQDRGRRTCARCHTIDGGR